MVVSLANSIVNNCRRIQWQYFSLVGGLTLAAFVALNFNDSTSPHSARRGVVDNRAWVVAPVSYRGTESVVIFYLAGNDEQKLKAELSEAITLIEQVQVGADGPMRFVNVLFARTADEESRALVFIDEAMAAANLSDREPAPRFDVIDLRTR